MPAGQRFSNDAEGKEYRRYFYTGLVSWGFGAVLLQYPEVRDKIKHFKLDYIIVERPSPYEKNITSHLPGYIREVYRDEWCILWQLIVP